MAEIIRPGEGVDPQLSVTIGGREVIATRENTSSYEHLGGFVLLNGIKFDAERFDHIHIVEGSMDDGDLQGHYIFSESILYDDVYEFVVEHEFPRFIDLHQVADRDIEEFGDFLDGAAKLELGDLEDDKINEFLNQQ